MRYAAATVVVGALLASTPASGKLSPTEVAFWTRVGSCETGSGGPPKWDWGAERRPGEGSSYEGGVGFAASTWRLWASALGLLRRFPHAYLAPAAVQMRVAQYGLGKGGYWGCLA